MTSILHITSGTRNRIQYPSISSFEVSNHGSSGGNRDLIIPTTPINIFTATLRNWDYGTQANSPSNNYLSFTTDNETGWDSERKVISFAMHKMTDTVRAITIPNWYSGCSLIQDDNNKNWTIERSWVMDMFVYFQISSRDQSFMIFKDGIVFKVTEANPQLSSGGVVITQTKQRFRIPCGSIFDGAYEGMWMRNETQKESVMIIHYNGSTKIAVVDHSTNSNQNHSWTLNHQYSIRPQMSNSAPNSFLGEWQQSELKLTFGSTDSKLYEIGDIVVLSTMNLLANLQRFFNFFKVEGISSTDMVLESLSPSVILPDGKVKIERFLTTGSIRNPHPLSYKAMPGIYEMKLINVFIPNRCIETPFVTVSLRESRGFVNSNSRPETGETNHTFVAFLDKEKENVGWRCYRSESTILVGFNDEGFRVEISDYFHRRLIIPHQGTENQIEETSPNAPRQENQIHLYFERKKWIGRNITEPSCGTRGQSSFPLGI